MITVIDTKTHNWGRSGNIAVQDVMPPCVSMCFSGSTANWKANLRNMWRLPGLVYRRQIRYMMFSDGIWGGNLLLITLIMKWEEITKWHGICLDLNDDTGHGGGMRNTCSAVMFMWHLVTVVCWSRRKGRECTLDLGTLSLRQYARQRYPGSSFSCRHTVPETPAG